MISLKLQLTLKLTDVMDTHHMHPCFLSVNTPNICAEEVKPPLLRVSAS